VQRGDEFRQRRTPVERHHRYVFVDTRLDLARAARNVMKLTLSGPRLAPLTS
jgi:hypothetical protein